MSPNLLLLTLSAAYGFLLGGVHGAVLGFTIVGSISLLATAISIYKSAL